MVAADLVELLVVVEAAVGVGLTFVVVLAAMGLTFVVVVAAGSRPMLAVVVVSGCVVVVVVALVIALILLPLDSLNNSHVHAWCVGVAVVGMFIGCSKSYAITSCARVIASRACCVGNAAAILI